MINTYLNIHLGTCFENWCFEKENVLNVLHWLRNTLFSVCKMLVNGTSGMELWECSSYLLPLADVADETGQTQEPQ